MLRRFIKEIRGKLEKEKISIEAELQKFAKKDEKLKGDWDTKYPKFNGGAGGQILEEAADEVEEYVTMLPIEHSLEMKLKDINLALEKIKEGKYGKCEKCGEKIDKERLRIFPEAKTCTRCRSSKIKR